MTTAPITRHRELADLNPATLVFRNVRTAAAATITDELVASIAEVGVIIPLVVAEAPAGLEVRDQADEVRPAVAGELVVVDGERRTRGAVKAGRETVPAVVVRGDTAIDEATRITEQLIAGLFQQHLDPGDTAAAIATLFDLDVKADAIRAITGGTRKEIAAARKIGADPDALAAAKNNPQLGFDTLLVIAEFADDPEDADAKAALLTHAGERNFKHIAESFRQRRDLRLATAKLVAKLAKAGVTVAEENAGESLYHLSDAPEGYKPVTEETHQDCPGRAVYIVQDYADTKGATVHGSARVRAIEFCVQPDRHRSMNSVNGKTPHVPGTPLDEDAKNERKQVVHNNKWWRASVTVRAAWLAEFAKRKTAPPDADLFIWEAMVRRDFDMTKGVGWHYCPAGLKALGIDPDAETEQEREAYSTAPRGRTTVLAMLDKAGPARRKVIVATLLLGAYEGDLSPDDGWRSVTPSRARYMRRLADWGYPVSPVEECLLDGKLDRWVKHPDGDVVYLDKLKADRKRAAAKAAKAAAAELAAAKAEQLDQDAADPEAEAERWPRIAAGYWVDRLATDDDDQSQVIEVGHQAGADDGIGETELVRMHLCSPGEAAELDAALGAVTPEQQAAALEEFAGAVQAEEEVADAD